MSTVQSTAHAVYRARHGLSEAALEILDHARYAILGTVNPDGSVHLVPVMFRLDAGRIFVQTSAATRKVRNVARCQEATVLAQDPRVNGEAWVSGTGPAEVVEGAAAAELGRRLRARYLTELGERELGSVLAQYDDTSIVVTPERWMSWDTGTYNAVLAAAGVPLQHAGQWFR